MGNTLFEIYVHIVFGTRNSENTIPQDVIPKLHGYIAKIFSNNKCHDIYVGGISNHVHILTSLPREVLVSEIVRSVKLATHKMLTTKYGLRWFSWQSGYAVFSVSPSGIPGVKNYIKNQKKHHIRITYKKELEKLEILCNFLNKKMF